MSFYLCNWTWFPDHVSYFSYCHDQKPERSNLKREDLFWVTLRGAPVHHGRDVMAPGQLMSVGTGKRGQEAEKELEPELGDRLEGMCSVTHFL